VIINAGSGDIGVSQPFLDFGDVSLIIQRIGRSAVNGDGGFFFELLAGP
jgi:hypothetical protein